MSAQIDSERISLISKPYGDSIVLRVMTNDYDYLKEIMTEGYVIKRQEVDVHNLNLVGDLIELNDGKKIKLGTQLALSSLRDSRYYASLESFGKIGSLESPENDQMFRQSFELASNVIGATDVNASKYLAIRFTDKDVEPGSAYIYYLELNHPNEERKIRLKTVVAENKLVSYPPPIINEINSSNRKIVVSWDREINNQNYFLYDVERSTDGVTYEVLNDIPLLQLYDKRLNTSQATYIDSVSNYTSYQYRIRGWSYFADRSPASEVRKGMGFDNVPPQRPSVAYLNVLENKGVVIQWSASEIENDLAQFEVWKSNDLNESFTKINSQVIRPNVFEYVEEERVDQYKNYYKVCAIDTADNRSCSTPKRLLLADLTPPTTPKLLETSIDSNGVVSLSWEANQEDDLWGYYVYKTNDKGTNFLRITNHPHLETNFKDTVSLNTLTKSLYYTVAALDVRANVSDFTDTISLSRPDKIAPSPALFVSGKSTELGRELQWTPSPFRDVVRQELYRAISLTDDWDLVETLEPFTNEYLDTLKTKHSYKYKLVTVDESNNKTISSNILSVKPRPLKEEINVSGISISQVENKIRISWETGSAIDKMILYKASDENAKLKRYQIFECDDCSYWEEDLTSNEDSIYKVQFKTKAGNYSAASKTLSLKH